MMGETLLITQFVVFINDTALYLGSAPVRTNPGEIQRKLSQKPLSG